ncbi:MAG TPA: YpfB family protein [Bacillus bacterium]|nr:YpfB family protein [Bacillus sp. (in: firmicutes)]
MKIVEKYIFILVILHLFFLIIGQWFISNPVLAPYVSKIIYYEGVMKDQYSEIIETMNR